ncbi:Tuberous sclerosis 2-like protein [Bachmanniomyces sp. S44760]|nr:Tuberous sclerosis 2-like protein [Bachmanniomyces sp. S44760]
MPPTFGLGFGESARPTQALAEAYESDLMDQPDDTSNPSKSQEDSSSPTFTERVRSLASGRGSVTSPRSPSQGLGLSTPNNEDVRARRDGLQSPGTDAEATFQQKIKTQLSKSRSLTERTKSAEALSKDFDLYSVDTLMEVWEVASDLVSADASDEARITGYTLLIPMAWHTGLGSTERSQLFTKIIIPSTPKNVVFQMRALKGLTHTGQDLEPFADQLIQFLIPILESQWLATLNARRIHRNQPEPREKRPLKEEQGLETLVSLIVKTITHDFDAFEDDQLTSLIDHILHIAHRTTASGDIKAAVAIMAAIVEKSHIPRATLKDCVHTLCAIYILYSDRSKDAWASLEKLLHSQDKQLVLDILLGHLRDSHRETVHNSTRGAISTIKFLVKMNGAEGLPTITIPQLMAALYSVHNINTRLQRDCLLTISFVLREEGLANDILYAEWETMMTILQIAAQGSYDAPEIHPSTTLRSMMLLEWTRAETNLVEGSPEIKKEVLEDLREISETFTTLWPDLDTRKKSSVAGFFLEMRSYLSEAPLDYLISEMIDQGFLIPTEEEWQNNQHHFLLHFVLAETMPVTIRSRALRVLKDSLLPLVIENDKLHLKYLVLYALRNLEREQDMQIINDAAELGVTFASVCDLREFHPTLTMLSKLVEHADSVKVRIQSDPIPADIVAIVTQSMVQLFCHCLERSPAKAKATYDALLKIVETRQLSAESRLPALKLLSCLRCDSHLATMVIRMPDTLKLAAVLCRTESTSIPNNENLNRSSLGEHQPQPRAGRSSVVSAGELGASRSSTRSAGGQERSPKPEPPLWGYPDESGLLDESPTGPSRKVFVRNAAGGPSEETLPLGTWLETIIGILQTPESWELYSYILVHLPSQLTNPSLFVSAPAQVRFLRNVVTSQLQSNKFQEAPANVGVKKGDIALCLYTALIALLGYKEHFAKSEQDDMVRAFLAGIGAYDKVAKPCIHALAIACHEIPLSIAKSLNAILQKMSQIITQSQLAMDVLEFLGGLARLPDVYVNLQEDELRTVFAICVRYLENSREQRLKVASGSAPGTSHSSNRHSGNSGEIKPGSESSHDTEAMKDLPQYVFTLAYHVMTFWFLSLKLADRAKHVGWITLNLSWKTAQGIDIMEEQSQVTLDMMHRTAFLDLGETTSSTPITLPDEKLLKKSWLVGLSVVTIETAASTGLSQIIKRQASGTTYATYQQQTAPLPPHHVPAPTEHPAFQHVPESRINVFPNHIFLQLMSTIAPTPAPMEPICLPDDEATIRAISAFDRNDTVDGHKVGVIYIGDGQISEVDILANTSGSETFDTFLSGLGTRVELRGATFNTQGLDRTENSDGTHTYAWRDRVTEIIYHVPTMMPTNRSTDPSCVLKKRHIGNDFVNIIFNESGLPFSFDTFPSQFNYVNIVITPENKIVPSTSSDEESVLSAPFSNLELSGPAGIEASGSIRETPPLPALKDYFTIQTQTHSSFPSISPAASLKLVTAAALPALARQLSLNASVFSLVWSTRSSEGGEGYVSSWRNRLREIVRLRERHANTGTSGSAKYPGARQKRDYVEGDRWTGLVAMGGLSESDGVLSGLDFSRWAGPNPNTGEADWRR